MGWGDILPSIVYMHGAFNCKWYSDLEQYSLTLAEGEAIGS